jgi:hypothetical protein
MFGIPTSVMLVTNTSGGAFTMLVGCQQWQTDIITSTNCRGLKDEKSWQHMLTTTAVLTGTFSCRDPAS